MNHKIMNPTRLKHRTGEKICRTYMNMKCKNQRIKSLWDNNNNFADFKFTSQANHLAKLINLKAETERQDRHI